jgi:hypothetical protein
MLFLTVRLILARLLLVLVRRIGRVLVALRLLRLPLLVFVHALARRSLSAGAILIAHDE